ncbi:MAG: cytochrome c oxidase subunit 3 [Candidatus Binatia bacterium]|nr:cytochrome c oxidase subunit 3 [Candidatus Binatia bacterium]
MESAHAPAGLWVGKPSITGVAWFLASEAALFGGLLAAVVYLRAGDPAWAEAATHVSRVAAAAATACLVVVTLSLARVVETSRLRRGFLVTAMIAAGLFVMVKAIDYWTHWVAGSRPQESVFWASFYLLTGLHALHVVGGLGALLYCAWLPSRERCEAALTWTLGVRLYWYLVDAVWVCLLLLFYLF